MINPAQCPLCGGANECQLCSHAAYKGPCWCMCEEIPGELLLRAPEDSSGRACICRACVAKFKRERDSKGGCAAGRGAARRLHL